MSKFNAGDLVTTTKFADSGMLHWNPEMAGFVGKQGIVKYSVPVAGRVHVTVAFKKEPDVYMDTWTWPEENVTLVEATSYSAEARGEVDPSGRPSSEKGTKLDAGKILPRLVLGEFSRALTEVVKVGTKGARKYTPRGWIEVPNGIERYAEAADRHQLQVNQGVVWDTDDGLEGGPVTKGGTGERHKAQVLWNLLAELELELRQ